MQTIAGLKPAKLYLIVKLKQKGHFLCALLCNIFVQSIWVLPDSCPKKTCSLNQQGVVMGWCIFDYLMWYFLPFIMCDLMYSQF